MEDKFMLKSERFVLENIENYNVSFKGQEYQYHCIAQSSSGERLGWMVVQYREVV